MKILLLGILLSFSAFADFDHSHKQWDKVLKEYTAKKDRQVYVNYRALKNEINELNSYLAQLEAVKRGEFKRFNEKQKLAFWINAYNAYTVKIILKNYPLKSIREISSGFFSSGPWKLDFITLLGKKMSLDSIEHDTIRKKFDEPRIHFAVNCASMGCPSLLPEAFIASKLDSQLDSAALNFLENKSKNYLENKTLYVSKIFKWYGDDFNKKHGNFIKYIVKTLNLPKKRYDIEFNSYDWKLNEIK